MLLETYEEFKHIITKKGNTTAINKAREKGWQEIADCLNAQVATNLKYTLFIEVTLNMSIHRKVCVNNNNCYNFYTAAT